MKNGYWINYNTQSIFEIDEHEQWIRRPGNGEHLGIPESIITPALSKYRPEKDRDRFLKYLMASTPIMRVRGHGDMVTFEFHTDDDTNPMKMIIILGNDWFGPYSVVNTYNFATKAHTHVYWKDLAI